MSNRKCERGNSKNNPSCFLLVLSHQVNTRAIHVFVFLMPLFVIYLYPIISESNGLFHCIERQQRRLGDHFKTPRIRLWGFQRCLILYICLYPATLAPFHYVGLFSTKNNIIKVGINFNRNFGIITCNFAEFLKLCAPKNWFGAKKSAFWGLLFFQTIKYFSSVCLT